MFRCQHTIGRAEERVWTCRENGECLIAILDLESDVCAFRFTDPVSLHLLETLGPIQ